MNSKIILATFLSLQSFSIFGSGNQKALSLYQASIQVLQNKADAIVITKTEEEVILTKKDGGELSFSLFNHNNNYKTFKILFDGIQISILDNSDKKITLVFSINDPVKILKDRLPEDQSRGVVRTTNIPID